MARDLLVSVRAKDFYEANNEDDGVNFLKLGIGTGLKTEIYMGHLCVAAV